ncbi:MAG: 4Fe-4S dicluster domain-containing protein [Rhodobacteraceae bacterium]|nr:4Fe-4S dicluster domain-containing protein [Paracoccaceae bacterium]
MQIVTVNPRKCVACRHCESVCSFQRRGHYNHHDSAIRVNHYPEQAACIPLTCVHCAEAWCQEVCPAAAISRDAKTNAVLIDATRCIGCKMCMLACPFGAINFDSSAQSCFKCDLCNGDPQCVKVCFPGALNFEREEDAARANRARHDNRMAAQFGNRNHD